MISTVNEAVHAAPKDAGKMRVGTREKLSLGGMKIEILCPTDVYLNSGILRDVIGCPVEGI